MTYSKLMNSIFESGKNDFEDILSYIEKSKHMRIKVSDGKLEDYTISESVGLSFDGLLNDKIGSSYTEKIDESSIDFLIKDAKENRDLIDSDDKVIIYEGALEYKEIEKSESDLDKISLEEKIDFLIKLEEAGKKYSDKIKSVNYCMYNEFENERFIYNTKGMNLKDKGDIGGLYFSVVAEENGDIKTGNYYSLKKNFNEYNIDEIVEEACGNAISLLGANTIASDNYNIIIKNDTFSSLLYPFISIFSADKIQKNMSLMKGKLNTVIANKKFNLVENPFLEDGYNSKTFDDEGTPTEIKDIIRNGELKTYLYNWKTAIKDNVKSTGNGYRDSYKTAIDISYSNIVVENGDNSFEELLEKLDNGILITDLQGLHSGLNAISGDFSLPAQGYEIVNGKISRPINQILIASNIIELLNSITYIGNDSKNNPNNIITPSIIIENIAVSGE